MGRKGTPFPHLQFLGQRVPPPQIVTMLGKGTRPRIGGPNLNVPFPTSNYALPLSHYESALVPPKVVRGSGSTVNFSVGTEVEPRPQTSCCILSLHSEHMFRIWSSFATLEHKLMRYRFSAEECTTLKKNHTWQYKTVIIIYCDQTFYSGWRRQVFDDGSRLQSRWW